MKKNQKDLNDFLHWNLTLKIRFRHCLTTHMKVSESQTKTTLDFYWFFCKNLNPVDPCLQNSTTRVSTQLRKFLYSCWKFHNRDLIITESKPALSAIQAMTGIPKESGHLNKKIYVIPNSSHLQAFLCPKGHKICRQSRSHLQVITKISIP